MGSCRGGQIKTAALAQQKGDGGGWGGSLGGQGLTPGGKINSIIISGNNKVTLSRNNVGGEVKVP